MYSRLLRAAAQHQSPVPSLMDANGRCLISRAAPINKGPPKVPFVTSPSPNGSQPGPSDIGPEPLNLGSDSTGLRTRTAESTRALWNPCSQTPLRRADVARSLVVRCPQHPSSHPRRWRLLAPSGVARPSRRKYLSTLPSQKSVTACKKLLQLERLGDDVRKLA